MATQLRQLFQKRGCEESPTKRMTAMQHRIQLIIQAIQAAPLGLSLQQLHNANRRRISKRGIEGDEVAAVPCSQCDEMAIGDMVTAGDGGAIPTCANH